MRPEQLSAAAEALPTPTFAGYLDLDSGSVAAPEETSGMLALEPVCDFACVFLYSPSPARWGSFLRAPGAVASRVATGHPASWWGWLAPHSRHGAWRS